MEIRKPKPSESFAASALTQITDLQLMNTIASSGFTRNYDTYLTNTQLRKQVHHNGARGFLQTANIHPREATGSLLHVDFIDDLDNRGILITDPKTGIVMTKVVLRDRAHDGTPEATSPYYLKYINGMAREQIPRRARHLAFTNWSYSNPGDVQPPNTHCAELSIVSSDPQILLLTRLQHKKSLFVDPHHLAQFIDDPFSLIPFDNPTEHTITLWWKNWFQVVERGLRGKEIPQPGQTCQRGFDGFFDTALHTSEELLKAKGFSHITAVPTWTYVLESFIKRGFDFVDKNHKSETLDFLRRIYSISLQGGGKLEDLKPQNPLISWLSVAPFVLQLNPDYLPTLGIDTQRQYSFQEIFYKLRDAVYVDGEIKTYPLSPGRNLWLSKKL